MTLLNELRAMKPNERLIIKSQPLALKVVRQRYTASGRRDAVGFIDAMSLESEGLRFLIQRLGGKLDGETAVPGSSGQVLKPGGERSACEKCWRDACGDAGEYQRLVRERDAAGERCTPEEHAGGEDASVCEVCGRRAVHVFTHQCMACLRESAQVDAIVPGH